MRNYLERSIRIAFMVGLVVFASCDNDDPTPFHESDLTSGTGTWKLTALTVTAMGQTGDALEDCLTDDILHFIVGGTYTHLVGANTCEAEVDESGSWSIQGKHLVMEPAGDDLESADIKLLNATTLKTSIELDLLGVPSTITATYTKQ